MEAERAQKASHLSAVLDFHDCDPVAYGLFYFARSGVALAVHDDFSIDSRRNRDGTEEVVE